MTVLESTWQFFEGNPVLAGMIGMALVVLLALLAGSSGKRQLQKENKSLSDKLARAAAHANEQSRIVSRMRSEQGTVASLALSLPSVVRELNSYDLNQRRVPELILQLAEAIFQPGQVLFYKNVTASSPQGSHRELRLIAYRGLGELPENLRRVALGQGKIGWAAEHKVDMLRDGWANLKRTDGIVVEDNHPILEADIVGPLVHATVEGDQVLGVLCIGSPGVRPRNEKLMFQLVTNLGSLAMVTAEQKSRLADQANTDGLTGLMNKRSFQPKLGEMIVEAERAAKPVGLFIFDIDHFKTYNDTNGHTDGDELLRAMGQLLKNSVRPDDLCCRWGGEEFIIAMPDTDGPSAQQAAERIRRAIEDYPFAHQEKQPNGNVTISGGVAVGPSDGADVTSLTKNADQALYESKKKGRNRVMRYRGVHIGSISDDDYRIPELAGTKKSG
ncbi:MAG: diguanylate cyclase [Acidobacteria bacterium]|nr:diguanylate cyclase [Acidobacteriota bacterium]NIM64014.1 diguanylate cyclase [Acidobacteriota bacterium]NIO58484.1 diguanylate cyclase [Acidobacteriota bacterium]NIQ29542.1 diguanylate cyclase [Acidobacteriota bacterium]NIQ84234.1 diguanylate cyclase [Acidobacteriota bacterium]